MACDPYRSSVVLALHMDGTNGSTTFADSSQYAHSVTGYNGAEISDGSSAFAGGTSAFFGGNNEYITTGVSNEFVLYDMDFAIEFFINLTFDTLTGVVFSTANGGLELICVNDELRLVVDGIETVTALITISTYEHIVVSRQGGNFTLFVNGVAAGTINLTTNWYADTNVRLGTASGGLSIFGFIDDFRFTIGYARYPVTGFTPPTVPFPDNQCLISGVAGSSGAYLERVVRVYERRSGNYMNYAVSSPVNGAFDIPVQTDAECFVIMHDSVSIDTGAPVGGVNNAVIYDMVLPT